MTDLAPYTGGANLPTIDDEGTALITRAVQQMQGAHQLAKALANTTFVPYHWRGKPDDVAAAIMYGASVGLEPMTALRGLYVVNGNPGMYARQMVALLQSKGHEVWTEEQSDERVTVAGRRRGSDRVERESWTIERAKTAGYVPTIDPKTGKYVTNDKGKVIGNEKYLTDPQAMLYARAASTVCRRVAADALAGLDHSVEELQTIKVESEIVRDRPKRESAASLLGSAAAPPTADEPEDTSSDADTAEPETPTEPATEDTTQPTPITQAQQRRMGALMREGNITDRDDALAYVNHIIGRTVSSRTELTAAEASQVIEALQADLTQPAEQAEQQAADEAAAAEGGDA